MIVYAFYFLQFKFSDQARQQPHLAMVLNSWVTHFSYKALPIMTILDPMVHYSKVKFVIPFTFYESSIHTERLGGNTRQVDFADRNINQSHVNAVYGVPRCKHIQSHDS